VTDFDYLATRNQIIEEALAIVNVKRDGQPLSAAQIAEGAKSLNLLVKSWTNKHVFLWSQVEEDLSTVASTASYTSGFTPEALGIDKAAVVVGDRDKEIQVITYSQYEAIEDKTRTGEPQYIAFYKVDRAAKVFLYPTPDQVYTVKFLSVLPLKDMEDADGYGDVTAQFQLALAYGLARLLHSKYPDEPGKMKRVADMSQEFFLEACRGDRQIPSDDRVDSLFPARRY
jgi:hypothetical protein